MPASLLRPLCCVHMPPAPTQVHVGVGIVVVVVIVIAVVIIAVAVNVGDHIEDGVESYQGEGGKG